MYKFKYDFWNKKYFPNFKEKIIESYNNSMITFISSVMKSPTKDSYLIKEFYNTLEYYYKTLLTIDIVDKKNHDNILKRLESIKQIKLYEDKSKVNGYTKNNTIYINKNLHLIKGLDKYNTYQAIIFHELSHILTNTFQESKKYINELYKSKKVREMLQTYNLDDKRFLEYGFSLLDEVIAQNTEEVVLYNKLGMIRKNMSYTKDDIIFPGRKYLSNFIEYSEFEEIGIKFAKCLKSLNITRTDTNDEILKKITKTAFEGNIVEKIKTELKSENDILDFALMIACMGRIKDAKYSKCGIGKLEKNELNCNIYLDIFNYLSSLHDNTKCDSYYKIKKY